MNHGNEVRGLVNEKGLDARGRAVHGAEVALTAVGTPHHAPSNAPHLVLDNLKVRPQSMDDVVADARLVEAVLRRR